MMSYETKVDFTVYLLLIFYCPSLLVIGIKVDNEVYIKVNNEVLSCFLTK